MNLAFCHARKSKLGVNLELDYHNVTIFWHVKQCDTAQDTIFTLYVEHTLRGNNILAFEGAKTGGMRANSAKLRAKL